MQKSEQYQAQLDDVFAKVDAIKDLCLEENREMTETEKTFVDEAIADDGTIAKLTADRDLWLKIESASLSRGVKQAAGRIDQTREDYEADPGTIVVPAKAKARGKVKSFSGPNAEQEAYAAGLFFHAALNGSEWAKQRLRDINMAQVTFDNTLGGFLVPERLESSMIRLVEDYGVARRECRVMPMGSGGTLSIPRRASGYTAYFVGENAAGTSSDVGFDQVQLDAKKLMVLSRWSSELPEDAIVQLGDLLVQEIAYSFAVKEDDCLFNGDGGSTYGQILGAANALNAGSIIDTASNVDTASEVVIGTFHSAVGQLPKYPGIQPKWYCHQSTYSEIMQRLAFAAGGNTAMDFANGMTQSFLGYPVVISQSIESVGASEDDSGSVFAYFGDLSMAATFGDKRGVSIAADSSIYFESDAIAIRGTERFDINVHERGTASAAGPLIALRYNAS